MKNGHAQNFFLAALFVSIAILLVHIPLVRAIVWSGEKQLTDSEGTNESPAIMQASNGAIWVVWASNRFAYSGELFYKTSSNYGLTWSSDIRLTDDQSNPSEDGTPSIMQASNGTIWVVWASLRTGNYELFYKTSNNNGASWSPPPKKGGIQLTYNASYDIDPSIMQASNGTIWVVWASLRTGNYELFYKTFNGAAWSSDTQLTTGSNFNKFPAIMQASNGTIWVVWSSYIMTAGNYELFYKTFNGAAWSSDTQLTYNSTVDNEGSSVAQARDGTVWVVWQFITSETDYLYYRIYDGLTWSSDMQLTSDNLAHEKAPSIAQMNDEKIWVMWAAEKNASDPNCNIYYRTSSEIIIHDVAITSVSPSSTRANRGETISISVVVQNQGDRNETFVINCYANKTAVESKTITLANGTSTTLPFSWNTTGIDYGKYTIGAEASVVSGEIDTADNVYTDGKVSVTFPGDVNGDFTVNIEDLILLNKAYGSTPTSPNWNQYADIDKDNIVNVLDLLLLGRKYG